VVNLLISAVIGIGANNRQYRIDRHHAANKEGQQQQSEQGDRHLGQSRRDPPGPRAGGKQQHTHGFSPSAPSRL